MSLEKTEAIVIRTVDFSETSNIVTFFTSDFGKVSTLAKGARRKKSPFESALDLLALCRIVFIHKSSESLDLLTEAKLIHRLRAVEVDITRLYACFYIAELLQNLTDEMDPHPELFSVTRQSLRLLEDSSVACEPVILRYELAILKETGHLPSLTKCVGCGKPIGQSDRISFGLHAGGVLCSICRPGHRRLVSIRTEIRDALNDFSDPKSDIWRNDQAYNQIKNEIRPVINQYLAELMNKKPRLQSYLSFL